MRKIFLCIFSQRSVTWRLSPVFSKPTQLLRSEHILQHLRKDSNWSSAWIWATLSAPYSSLLSYPFTLKQNLVCWFCLLVCFFVGRQLGEGGQGASFIFYFHFYIITIFMPRNICFTIVFYLLIQRKIALDAAKQSRKTYSGLLHRERLNSTPLKQRWEGFQCWHELLEKYWRTVMGEDWSV